MKSLKWELHSCQYRGTWPNWSCLYFWMVVDIEVLRKQGGAHSREGRDKTPVKRLSRLFAHHCSLRPHPCLYNYIFYKNCTQNLWTSLIHVSDVSKLDTCLSGCWWQICTALKTHKFSQSVDKNLFISAKSGSKMSDFQSVPKASSKLIFTLERTCVKNIMFREGRQKRGLLFWFRAYEVQSFAPARQRQTKQILELRNPKYAINIWQIAQGKRHFRVKKLRGNSFTCKVFE